VDDESVREWTHGFHTYPARFHPVLVRRLLEDLPPKARVLDPFVGSGTVLIETALRGGAGLGVDLNPLAVELAWLKSMPWGTTWRATLVAAAEQVVTRVSEKTRASRRRSASASSPPPRPETRYDDPSYYPPHVYRELVALRLAIDDVTEDALRRALLLILSSIIVKVSRQRSDTDDTLVERAIPRGAATRHFAQRTEELVRHMAEFAVAVPMGTPAPKVRLGDARHLDHIHDASIDRVIASPPYLGTYDYTRHHRRRFGWLGLDPARLERGEIGARRGGADPERAMARWERDVHAYLGEIARVLRPGAWAYLLIGDSVVGRQAVVGYEAVERAAPAVGLTLVARASQQRPELLGPTRGLQNERREHLLALRRGERTPARDASS
jgi:SAM-dependent methyltransferase